jgi:O-antigen/teichoic acid export membrane protein
MGRPDISFKVTVVMSPVLVAGVYLGSRGGMNGIALATCIAHGLSVWLYVVAPFRALRWDIRCMFTALTPAFVSSAIAGVLTAIVYSIFDVSNVSLLGLMLLTLAGTAIYASAMFSLFRRTTLDIVNVIMASLREARAE